MADGDQPLRLDADEQASLGPVKSVRPSPDVVNKIVNRLRAMTNQLLPVEIDPKSINEPTSRVITPQVIDAYRVAAGDFVQALPYCLLRARAEFMYDANHNAADYDENYGRAIACEVIARRIVHRSEPEKLSSTMSARFRHRQIDGDISDYLSCLEMAIDTNCTIFLSSSEAQDVVLSLWNGDLVQKNNSNNDIEYVPYADSRQNTFWGHIDPERLSVPRYQNFFRIVVWIFFLIVYSQAVETPVENLNKPHQALDEWEIILYVLSLSFIIEDMHQFYKLIHLFSWRSFGFWNIVSMITDSLLLAAFVLRVIGLGSQGNKVNDLRTTSFMVLSFVAPLIWMKLIRVFDGYKYIGTMQICVARMLRESGIFFCLLFILAIGFFQGLWALDLADGTTNAPSVVHLLVQALLQSPDFESLIESPSGITLYYLWNVVTVIILLNVLISLFSSAYEDVVDDAEGQYLAFFAGKTVGMIRTPDNFVYPSPFNLIEAFFIAPLEICGLSSKKYTKLNRWVMAILFFVPLCMIALYESTIYPKVDVWLKGDDQGPEDTPNARDPQLLDDEADGLEISKVPYTELIKVFPDTTQSAEATMMKEISELRKEMAELKRLISGAGNGIKSEQ